MRICLFCLILTVLIFPDAIFGKEPNFSSNWIAPDERSNDQPNQWIAFRQNIYLKKKAGNAVALIAADTKYWLWLNGELVIFEGGLKRGPNSKDSYYDKIDVARYLKKGENKIAILVWHFGKNGFSHINSGRAGLLFQMRAGSETFKSDRKWKCRYHPAYSNTNEPFPNYRLPESNIRFDARKDIPGWQVTQPDSLTGFTEAKEIGRAGDRPWNKLIERPIPQWKNFGSKEIDFERRKGSLVDTIFAQLPYNMQMTPIIVTNDKKGGHLIGIETNHSKAGGTNNLRAEYITTAGINKYESYGWLNGEQIILTVPTDVEIVSVNYRETGYNTEPEGDFISSDAFYNNFWTKARRTLYVNMRDNYFDCPDRERAQWWGDVVLLMGESFYTYSTSTHALMRKAIKELVAWQDSSGKLFSPIPGVFKDELPDQMLTSIGKFGFWNYYMNTGDVNLLKETYPAIKKYLALWQLDERGLPKLRGDWIWGDWGNNRDINLIIAGWYYIALDAAASMAELLRKSDDAVHYHKIMTKVKDGYNLCWDGEAYRHPSYKEKTDDRVQALAVISGIADSTKYKQINKALQTHFYASPYMEKYVMEALFIMGNGKYALDRTKMRFQEMVNHPYYTTLFEGWGIGENGFGGGTTNHAWSGGAQIVIAQYLFGIKPLEAGYKTILIEPAPSTFTHGSITIPSVMGKISTSFIANDRFLMNVTIPKKVTAIVRLPRGENIKINGKELKQKQLRINDKLKKQGVVSFRLKPGYYEISTPNVF